MSQIQPLSSLPNKQYFTIGETADYCNLKAYVLRYWEQEFPRLNPIKRNKRRYYQVVDINYIIKLKDLLHEQGYSIQGAKALLKKELLNEDNNSETNQTTINQKELVTKVSVAISQLEKLSNQLEM